ncbi:hypothetical protein MMC26_006240 [Xylographa opegraphella]|nr:hypothetical protein [Xylographa opegraphella]
MQFSSIILLACATLAMAAPTTEKRGDAIGNLLRRAINKSFFTAEELANTDRAACCCCKPPSEITNVDILHRIIAASE